MMAYMYYVRDNVIRHELDLDCTLFNKVHCTHFLRTNPYYVSNYINGLIYSVKVWPATLIFVRYIDDISYLRGRFNYGIYVLYQR